MNIKNDLSRMTIDIPKQDHMKLKAMAAVLGKSMKEIVIESLELFSANLPNNKMLEAISNIREDQNSTIEAIDNLKKSE